MNTDPAWSLIRFFPVSGMWMHVPGHKAQPGDVRKHLRVQVQAWRSRKAKYKQENADRSRLKMLDQEAHLAPDTEQEWRSRAA